jgi:hypothetical protein
MRKTMRLLPEMLFVGAVLASATAATAQDIDWQKSMQLSVGKQT